MTSNQGLALGVGVIGLYLLSRKTAAAAVTTPVVAPARGVISYPGYSPSPYLQPGGGSGIVPPLPVQLDPLTGSVTPTAPDTGSLYEVYGTGMTASELTALGYTPSQISAMGMSGDPAISAILNLNPPTPVYQSDGAQLLTSD